MNDNRISSNSKIEELKNCRLAVVAHDAGAAAHILGWIKSLKQIKFCMKGPALRLLVEKRKDAINLGSLDECLADCDVVICGSGWQSDLEHKAINLAKEKGLRTISVVDHWVNYTERFVRAGEISLPDEIWVSDEYAKRIAEIEFPELKICKLPN